MSSKASSVLEVMNFLNEVAADYPRAVSFASGRPAETLFRDDLWTRGLPKFLEHYAARLGTDIDFASRQLAQYGRTAGLVNDIIATQLNRDESLNVEPGQIVVTTGCQEAISLCIQALCPSASDIVLVRSPTYIGITGAAHGSRIQLEAIDEPVGVAFSQALEAAIVAAKARGLHPRALYITPDFDNPTGSVLELEERRALLSTCGQHHVVVLEDNPYGMFCYEGIRLPTLFALDSDGVVVYLGTYSKTICPALRVGCAVVPKSLFGSIADSKRLLDDLIRRKSFVTVNTSQFNQALAGGLLLLEDCSLDRFAKEASVYYRRNRDRLISALGRVFSGLGDQLTWNRPRGGFFLTVALPFSFGREHAMECAQDFDVLLMPMSFFTMDGSRLDTVRVAFSNLDPKDVELGVERFSRYVQRRFER
jgi:(S)-3,5-dihydroxyphenylglycine transaminase